MIHRDLYTKITTDLGSKIGTRAYPLSLPQPAVLPAVTFRSFAGTREYAHDGDQSLSRHRIQLSCWAGTYDEARKLAEDLTAALDGWQAGTICSTPVDISQPGVPVFQVAVDIDVWYEE